MNFPVVRYVMGIPVRFNCESEQITEIISHIYPLKSHDESESEIDITISHTQKESLELASPPLFEYDNEHITGRSGSNYFIADRSNRCGEAFLCQRMLNNEYMLRHQVLNTLCFYLLTYKFYLPVHAACFQLNQHQVLCLGGSGSGKSTLAMAAKQHNLPVISEDLCFIGPNQKRGIQADCREFHLYPDSYARFKVEEKNEIKITHNGKLKHIISNYHKSHLNDEIEITDSKVLVLFITAKHSQADSQFEVITNKKNYSRLLNPEESGFDLFSQAREPAVNWLKTSPSVNANIGYNFNSFFNGLEEIQEKLSCGTQ